MFKKIFIHKTFLISLLLIIVMISACSKEERVLQTHVEGTVTDYFEGNAVEGVTVAVVYTYGFSEFICNGTGLCNFPEVEPDTIARATTNSNGEFKLKFRAKKNMDKGGITNSPFGEPNKYGYLLIFYKNGTEYFKQFYNIDDGAKRKYNVNYEIKPLITFEFNVRGNNNPNEIVYSNFNTSSGLYYYQIPSEGINIQDRFKIRTEWINEIVVAGSIWNKAQTSIYYYSKKETITPIKKIYTYDIIY